MKKVLAIVVCICIALTVSVTAFAASSAESNFYIENGTAKGNNGESISNGVVVTISNGKIITIFADQQTYGGFDKWEFFVISPDGTKTPAKEGVDFKFVSGNANSPEAQIETINDIKLGVYGNYKDVAAEDVKDGVIDTNVMIRKGIGTREDGTSMAIDKFVYVPIGTAVTANADEKTYGKFNSWSVYVIEESAANSSVAGGASLINLAVTDKAVKAKAGTDYQLVSGNLKSKSAKIKILSNKKVVICGNYGGTITDPFKSSSEAGSPKTNDIGIMYAVMVLLAAGAVILGAKRQLSK